MLVDGLWPRGVRKDDPRVGTWMPAIAPSRELRKWYGHEPARFGEFQDLYLEELKDSERAAALVELMGMAPGGLTLTTATRELEISQAAVLQALLS